DWELRCLWPASLLGYAAGEDGHMCSASSSRWSPWCRWHIPARPILCGSPESTTRGISTKSFGRLRVRIAFAHLRDLSRHPDCSLPKSLRRSASLQSWRLLSRQSALAHPHASALPAVVVRTDSRADKHCPIPAGLPGARRLPSCT